MKVSDILICPESHNTLRLDTDASVMRAEAADTVYPVTDGIIDFCDPHPDPISASYDKVAPRYDACLTSSTLSRKSATGSSGEAPTTSSASIRPCPISPAPSTASSSMSP